MISLDEVFSIVGKAGISLESSTVSFVPPDVVVQPLPELGAPDGGPLSLWIPVIVCVEKGSLNIDKGFGTQNRFQVEVSDD